MKNQAQPPTRFFRRLVPALLLALALGTGCADDAVAPGDMTMDDHLESLGLTVADLEGSDLEALQQAIDFGAVAEAVRTSERDTEPAAFRGGPVQIVRPGESIQAAVDAAPDGGIVLIRRGTYEIGETIGINKPLHLVGLGRPGTVVIKDSGGLANGIAARGVNGLSIINLKVEGFSKNGVYLAGVDGFLLHRVVTDQLGEGAYGLFPLASRNGLITRCTATGADDAGIYVGQSENVAVVHSEAYGNVIGLEAENVKQTVWAHNRAYDNAAGMLAILLPPGGSIEVLHAEQLVVAHNRFTDNNGENFAEEGELAASVPSGTGLLVFGYDDSLIHRNRVTGNGFVGIGLGSTVTLWLAAGRELAALAPIDPHPDDVRVVRNRVTGNGFGPPLALPGFPPIPAVDLLWDRDIIAFLAENVPGFPFGAYGEGNCWEANTSETSFPDALPSCGTGA